MQLLIDDTRDIGTEVTARTWGAGKALICPDAPYSWDVIYFDHDLAEKNPEDTGYTLLREALQWGWLERRTKVGIVTSNPVGRENMERALRSNGYAKDVVTQLWAYAGDIDG